MTAPSDGSLLGAAQAGDADALERLLLAEQPRVYRMALSICRDPEDAKDVLQETLLAAARGIGEFRGASSLSTWLYAIARSFCRKKLAKQKLAVASLSVDALGASGADQPVDPARPPDDAVADREVRDALSAAIGALDPKYREVLVLRDVEGLSAPEAAATLGLTVEAVKSRLHRARASVRERVAPVLGVAPDGAGPPGAGCPDVLRLFSQRLDGEVSAEACADMERHLRGCPRCRGACESLRRTLDLCRTAPGPQVPDDVQESVRLALRRALAQKV